MSGNRGEGARGFDLNERLRLLAAAAAVLGFEASALAAPSVVPTFESLGVSWSPTGGGSSTKATVKYRAKGSTSFKTGYPLWFDSRNSEYRGSIVGLVAGTTYEVELSLAGGATESVTGTTWSNTFPIAKTVVLPATSNQTLTISQSGSPSGYVLYTHADAGSASIDVKGDQDNAIVINASYVIVRGLTLKNARRNGIRIDGSSHDVVIEGNDITNWGRIASDGWGENYDAAVYSNSKEIERIIIQRNRMHHPRSDSNHWDEYRELKGTAHPMGPQAIVFFESRGNHVFRYNSIYSDDDHRMNDCMGAGSNYSTIGFPNRDSDIYGNFVSHCWDDGIESEGANENVRIWGNFIEHSYVKIATATTSIGPLYVFRNVAGIARRNDTTSWDSVSRGGFLKTASNEGGGRIFVFHNTLLQPKPPSGSTYTLGCDPGFGHGGPMLNTMSRNNILHIAKNWHSSITDSQHDPLGNYDFDLYNGNLNTAPDAEPNGIKGVPSYSAQNGDGEFALDPSSPGFDDGEVLPNFNDGYAGAKPDIGAFEAGSPPMQFGVDAFKDQVPAGGAGGAAGAGAGGASGSSSGGMSGGDFGGNSAGGAGASSAGGGSAGAALTKDGKNDAEEDAGCACRTRGGSGRSPFALALVAAFLVLSSRRRLSARG